MVHLRKKYVTELDYMLREFRKLERQLLGAKGNAPGVEESAGSKERREKLHSFILHLEDTIRQIEVGCKLEAEGKSTLPHTQQPQPALPGAPPPKPQPPAVAGTSQLPVGNNTALAKMNKEKEEEENIQKLEEHILANLLPVKVRLKKQLAVQQGASRNPAGMPVTRRGVLQPPADKGKGTFVAAVEEKRKQAEAVLAEQQRQKELAEISASGGDDSQFGKPLNTAASSLTLKLHGSTLGSGEREDEQVETTGSTTDPLAEDGDPSETPKRKVFYAGMTPGSEQHRSGVSAAAGAHKMIIETPGLLRKPQQVLLQLWLLPLHRPPRYTQLHHQQPHGRDNPQRLDPVRPFLCMVLDRPRLWQRLRLHRQRQVRYLGILVNTCPVQQQPMPSRQDPLLGYKEERWSAVLSALPKSRLQSGISTRHFQKKNDDDCASSVGDERNDEMLGAVKRNDNESCFCKTNKSTFSKRVARP